MRAVRATIAATGGSAVLLRAQALSGGPEITAAFNEARDREYETVITSCRDAAAAIETILAAGESRSGQLPDSDTELKRLDTRYRAAARHDLLGAAKAAAAMAALDGYRSLLDQYATHLDARDNRSLTRSDSEYRLVRLATDLYEGCGLSLPHIELLTGQPTAAVSALFHSSDVQLRPAGGRSPFMRRWRDPHMKHATTSWRNAVRAGALLMVRRAASICSFGCHGHR